MRRNILERLTEWRNRRRVHRQVKDRLFRFLFDKDREALLQLYNALNGTDYQDASALQVVTIENAVYVVMKNDLAFIITDVLNLYEHQSTVNPNMPVRFLLYLAQEYQTMIEEVPESLYGTRQITLPLPHCVVFYNGEKEMPEEQILRLSDAFENREQESDVEVTVRMLNINYGHNAELMEKCRMLREYAEFVDIARKCAEGTKGKADRAKALNEAVDYCIENHILEKYLRKYRAEVIGMLLEKFDVKKYERSLRREGYEEGLSEGFEKGRNAEKAKAEEHGIKVLIETCQEAGLSGEFVQSRLVDKYAMSLSSAEAYLKKYWKSES